MEKKTEKRTPRYNQQERKGDHQHSRDDSVYIMIVIHRPSGKTAGKSDNSLVASALGTFGDEHGELLVALVRSLGGATASVLSHSKA